MGHKDPRCESFVAWFDWWTSHQKSRAGSYWRKAAVFRLFPGESQVLREKKAIRSCSLGKSLEIAGLKWSLSCHEDTMRHRPVIIGFSRFSAWSSFWRKVSLRGVVLWFICPQIYAEKKIKKILNHERDMAKRWCIGQIPSCSRPLENSRALDSVDTAKNLSCSDYLRCLARLSEKMLLWLDHTQRWQSHSSLETITPSPEHSSIKWKLRWMVQVFSVLPWAGSIFRSHCRWRGVAEPKIASPCTRRWISSPQPNLSCDRHSAEKPLVFPLRTSIQSFFYRQQDTRKWRLFARKFMCKSASESGVNRATENASAVVLSCFVVGLIFPRRFDALEGNLASVVVACNWVLGFCMENWSHHLSCSCEGFFFAPGWTYFFGNSVWQTNKKPW